MCFLCGNDFSQQEYDRNSYLLKEKISNLETANAQLNISLINKESEIYNLEVKLKELEDKENDKDEYDIKGNSSHSAIKFLQQLLNEIPYRTNKTDVADLKENINNFLNDKITTKIGYLTDFSFVELDDGLSISVGYNTHEYDKKDIIIFRELMMKTIDNKDLVCEMGWIINYNAGVDLFISRSEVGIRIRLKPQRESYYHCNDTSDFIYALLVSHNLID
ncbi:hypothetical protein [Photobacterium leiognathi]|uniref:hypothetical protein n=1 Tax=Photobacterium leiognathi TaxID=553611 RepID=UPI002981D4C1|nr:hypothetical protein [Photobacterium leiognathi]